MAGAAGARPGARAQRAPARQSARTDSTREKLEAFAPYIIIVVVFAIAKLVDPIERFLFESGGGTASTPTTRRSTASTGRGSTSSTPNGEAPSAQTFQFSFWDTPGTIVLLCGLLTIPVLRIRIGEALRAYGATLNQLKFAIITVMAVLASPTS